MRQPTRGRVAVACYVVAAVCFLVAASAPGSPLRVAQPQGLPDGWPFSWFARVLGLTDIGGAALASVLLTSIGFTAAFLLVARAAWRGALRAGPLLLLAITAQVVVLLLPIMSSRDVFSYVAYGRITAVHHANPYLLTPARFPVDAVFPFVAASWRHTPPVYGPLFTTIGAAAARVVSGVGAQTAAMRGAAALASIATLALIAATTRTVAPGREAFAVAAYGLSPVVPALTVVSGHNDVLVALAIAAAAWATVRGRPAVAVVALTLGTLVKITVAPVLAIVVCAWIFSAPPEARGRRAVVALSMMLAIGLAVAGPFLSRADPTLGQRGLAGHEGWLAVERVIRLTVSGFVGDGLATIAVRSIFAAALVGSVVWCCVVAARESSRGGMPPIQLLALGGTALLVTLLLIPANLPWYIVWVLPLAWVLPWIQRSAILAIACVQFLSLPVADASTYPTAFQRVGFVANEILAPAMLVIVVLVLRDAIRRLRSPDPRFADNLSEGP